MFRILRTVYNTFEISINSTVNYRYYRLTFDPTKWAVCHVKGSSLQNMFIHETESIVISMLNSPRNDWKEITPPCLAYNSRP